MSANPSGPPGRVVIWFSCGVTSAIAAKMALNEWAAVHECHVVYCDPGAEHPDNQRFLHDIEQWLAHPIEVLRSTEYRDTWDVFERTRWLNGVKGARCTTELKKKLRHAYQRPDDIQVFGFDADERARADRFRANNPDVDLRTPLIARGLTKADCLALVERAGIELPAMYRLGFSNANCIGCVKGGAGYWNKIRRHFPEAFARMAQLERQLNAALLKRVVHGQRQRLFLDELSPDAGRPDEVMPECSLLCAATEHEWVVPDDSAGRSA